MLPHEEILPKEMYKDLLKTFLLLDPADSKPSNKSKLHIAKGTDIKNIDSKIIMFQHAELISKWIDRLETTDKIKNSYKFKLLFRGSCDGTTVHIKNSVKMFHEICDNQSRTVTNVKVEDSDKNLGGYNPIEWYEPFMNFHESEAASAGPAISYDFVRFFHEFS